MARPEKNTVDYYPFIVGEGKKMFFIDKKYGNDGYATWMKILDKLCTTEYHYLNLNKEEEVMFLAAKCNVSEERLFSIITDIAKLGKFDRDMWDYKVIWCQSFIDSIQDAYSKRNNKCITLHGLRVLLTGLGVLKHVNLSSIGGINSQSKVEETKTKKKREKKSSEATPSDGIYTQCMALYDGFIRSRTGVGAKIDSKQGSALNKIIEYLKTQIVEKEKFSELIPFTLQVIFKNHSHWNPYAQEQLNLNQIESNLINIINSIKNGRAKVKSKSKAEIIELDSLDFKNSLS